MHKRKGSPIMLPNQPQWNKMLAN